MKITLNDISKSFDRKHPVLSHLNLTMDAPLTTLLGFSGCGKTTLLRIISGLETPEEGEIYFDDRLVFSAKKKINLSPKERQVGFVFQDFALWPNMNVRKNVEFPLHQKGAKKDDIHKKADEALKLVHMEDFEKRMPYDLSGGQKQRVAIARAIATSPKVLLFDEPLSALDAILREQMRVEIKTLVKRLGITSVFVTHDQQEAMSISDKIIIMENGQIKEEGKPQEIYSRPKKKFVATFISKASFLSDTSFLRMEDIHLERRDKNEICLYVRIENSEYQGGCYLLSAKKEDMTFYFKADKDYMIGTKIPIYYQGSSVKVVGS